MDKNEVIPKGKLYTSNPILETVRLIPLSCKELLVIISEC